jgi:Domain of unknown function (DUF5668)
MTDDPTTPSDATPTVRYDPPAPEAPVAPAEPTPTPAPPTPAPAAPPPPAWQRTAADSGRTGSVVLGVILVAIGLWFFADQTLGLDMPRLDWGDLWPLIIIGIGAWIVLSSLGRRNPG